MTLSSPLRSLRLHHRRRSMVLVPLLETEPTRHALDLACRLARERGTARRAHRAARGRLGAAVQRALPAGGDRLSARSSPASVLWSRVTGSPPAVGSCGLGPARSAERWHERRARHPRLTYRRRSDCRLDSSLSPALLAGCVVGSPRRAVPRDDRHATGRVKDATLQGPAGAFSEARGRRQADGHGRARGDTAPEDPRASDLRLGPAVVGRLRDRGRDGRPHRRLGRSGPPGLPDLDRDRGAARDRRPLVQTDGPGLRDERRRLRRRQGESRHPAEPRRSGRSAHRLRTHGRRVDSRRHLRGHLARSIAQQPQGRALARVPRGDRPRQPARRSRVGSRLRASDVRLRDCDVRSRRGRSCEDASSDTHRTQWCRTRLPRGPAGSRSSSSCGRSRRARPR